MQLSEKIKFSLSKPLSILLMCASFNAFATDKGLFWKMESPTGVVSYLFGTMHTDDNRVADLSPNVLEAIKNVDTFMMESAENRDPSVMLLKEGNLASQLTEQEFEQVRELADFHVMHLGAAMQMKPWLLAVVFDCISNYRYTRFLMMRPIEVVVYCQSFSFRWGSWQ